MKISADELSRLRNAQTEDDWNDACDAIKKARNGEYPPDWWLVVVHGGIMSDFELLVKS